LAIKTHANDYYVVTNIIVLNQINASAVSTNNNIWKKIIFAM